MIPFEFESRTRLVFGPGKLSQLGELTRQIGGERVLLVSDPGLVAAGHAQRAIDLLEAVRVPVRLFSEFAENPHDGDVEAGVRMAKEFRPDVLIGLGGGSSLDCAKGINFVYSCGGRIHDYWGVGKAPRPMLPMIAVPTTAGTGSEAQSFALISDRETHAKMACGDKKAACRVALLDPELTATQPPRVTALTGLDAVAHAVETYVTRRRNPISLAFSREAWRQLEAHLPRVLRDPHDLEARGAMLLGAHFAGLAIENSMLGAAHSLANPLTQHFGIAHGQAVALMLPHVVRFNGQQVDDQYRELLSSTAGRNGKQHVGSAADELAARLTELTSLAGLATRLSELNVPADSLPQLAAGAAVQWTAQFNPREVGESELRDLYAAALD